MPKVYENAQVPPRCPINCVGVEVKGSQDNEPCHAANRTDVVGKTDSGLIRFAEKEGLGLFAMESCLRLIQGLTVATCRSSFLGES